MTPTLENIDWHKFLDRPPIPPPSFESLAALAGQPILITGAGGSIGSALAHRLLVQGFRTILLEASESNLFDLQQLFADARGATPPSFYLGNAADRGLLDEIFAAHNPRIVIHAAAFKHVPLLEEQPFAAIANNIFATKTLVEAALVNHSRILLLSSDKAVSPASLMGATKRVAEQVVLAEGGTVLRLGNVLGSSGSVTEVFARQIAAGLPLAVTDPAARRYFLTLEEAVNLLLAAAAESSSPALFVPDLNTSRYIADLARLMVHTLAPDREIPIEFTHLRPGDKESEALYSPSEIAHAPRADGLVLVDSPLLPTGRLHDLLEDLKHCTESRDSAATLSILRLLVPDYTPSRVVETCLTRTEPPVHNV